MKSLVVNCVICNRINSGTECSLCLETEGHHVE